MRVVRHRPVPTRRSRAWLATLVVAAAMGSGCTSPSPPEPDTSPLTTAAADPEAAVCGLEPTSVERATGVAVDHVRDEFTGAGPPLRGRGAPRAAERDPESLVLVQVDDATSGVCTWSRDVLEGRGPFSTTAPFEALEGVAWGSLEARDVTSGRETWSAAFVGGVCVRLGIRPTAEVTAVRDPVVDIEALTRQAITTLGLDPASS